MAKQKGELVHEPVSSSTVLPFLRFSQQTEQTKEQHQNNGIESKGIRTTGRSIVLQQRPPDVARAMIPEPRVELLARDAGLVQNLLLFRLGGIRRVEISRGQEPGS